MINNELSLLEKVCKEESINTKISRWQRVTTNMVGLGFKFELKGMVLVSISRTVNEKTEKMHTSKTDETFDQFCSMLPIIYIMEEQGAKLHQSDCNKLRALLREICYSCGDLAQTSKFALAVNEFVDSNDGWMDDLIHLHRSYLELIGLRDGIDYFAFDRTLFSGFYNEDAEKRICVSKMLEVLEAGDHIFYELLV